MPRGKKNSATSAVSKTANKPVEPIKETAAEPEKKSVKPTAEKKKATAPKKAAATKSSAKARTTKKASTSADVKAENVSVTETKKAATKSASKTKKDTVAKPKAAAKKPVAKTEKKTVAIAPKRIVKKSAKVKSDEVVIQSGDKDYTLSEITQICKDAYRGGTRKQVKSIKVYVKAEGNKLKAYYVVNDSVNGSVDL